MRLLLHLITALSLAALISETATAQPPICFGKSQAAVLEYDFDTGEVVVFNTGTQNLALIDLTSESGLFIPGALSPPAASLSTDVPERVGFALFGSNFAMPGEAYSLGNILPANLGLFQVEADVTAIVDFEGGGQGSVTVAFGRAEICPEPGALLLVSIAAMIGVFRRQR